MLVSMNTLLQERRSLRGNVDRNVESLTSVGDEFVVPYVGTWIEILEYLSKRNDLLSRSLRGNVDRNFKEIVAAGGKASRSLRGNVDRNVASGCKVTEEYVVPYVGTWIEMS